MQRIAVYLNSLGACALALAVVVIIGAGPALSKDLSDDLFRQLEETLPSPNAYRTASGAPGHAYWQQRADYVIDVELDDVNQRIIGSETITYQNHSPDELRYLWLQLDANIFAPNSHGDSTRTSPSFDKYSMGRLRGQLARREFDGSTKVSAVRDAAGKPLDHAIVGTMMRVDLPQPLRARKSVTFSVDWSYQINDAKVVRARTGYEFFEEDGNYIYEIAQWFPRMCAYTDVNGWQHKQFIGSGEFTLEMGDYLVSITAPDDHVVTATGELQNPEQMLSETQRARLHEAKTAERPMFIITPEEAKANEKSRSQGKKTWVFSAKQVRDFAFASSRKFIWDAKLHEVGGNGVMCMSLYPNEGEPLWSKYSTHAIMHTLDVYSRYTFSYPYPVAISVNGPVGGMEYPMICFNGPRPEKDGTYSKRTKYGLISVIIHEVGHNYFPMIVNSDERQWTWMDEGLNTFLQYLSEQEWEEDYPSRRGEAKNIVSYMRRPDQVPIMTNSESLLQFGNNAYAKPATALNVLRETVLGRELFDFAFKEYARRWRFKRPMPADLFRTLEDASGVDLDWFWRGWFYSTDHCDISIANVRLYTLKTGDPAVDKPRAKERREAEEETLSERRNKPLPKRVEQFPELMDFYNEFDELDITDKDRADFTEMVEKLEKEDRELLGQDIDQRFYVVELRNLGGLVMPVILEIHYADGEVEELRIPAEIWRRNAQQMSKLLICKREIDAIVLDPHLETADVDTSNNRFPRLPVEETFELKPREKKKKNPMQVLAEHEKKKAAEDAAEEAKEEDEPAGSAPPPGDGDSGSAPGADADAPGR